MTSAISWFFLGYFVVLFGERIQSLVKIEKKKFFATTFDIYVNVVSILSMILTVFMLVLVNKNFWISLVNNSVAPNYMVLSITATIMLISGMVHTEKTIAPIQFVSYGLLIVAMVLRTIQAASGWTWWYSLVFVVVLSMAIPVVYPSKMKNALLFEVLEAIVSILLVFAFGFLLAQVMTGNGTNLLWLPAVLLVAIGDTALIIMQWKEGANYFVFVFEIITLVMYVLGKILFKIF